MIASSAAYQVAIVGATRQIVAKSLLNLIDPDIHYGAVTSSGQIIYSRPEQLHDHIFDPAPPRVTLELNRWGLNGQQRLYRDEDLGEQGFISEGLSTADSSMAGIWVQLNTSNLSTLQACAVYFTGTDLDGIAEDFTLEIYSGSALVWSQNVTGNKERSVFFDGFLVYDVTGIRVIPTKWSLPYYRMRVIEIIPGLYEEWDGKTIYSLDVMQQADFSCLSLPYGTARLTIRNEDRRFDPREKNSLFQSVEARQAIPLELGVVTDDGIDYKPLGTFYQQTGGWSIDSNGLLITWNLVDIIGLIAQRKYEVPTTVPTTLSGWLASIVVQLGPNFADRYMVEPTLGETPLSCDRSELSNVTCGDLLRWVCQAAGAYPVADPVTGYLTAKQLDDTVTRRISLRALNDYPSISANTDLAAIIFKVGEDQITIGGTNTASSKTVSVSNPFITTNAQVQAAAKNILINYGGNKINARGRGDMANEVGDVNAVEIIPNGDMSGRRYKQQFTLTDGMMINVPAYFVQATGITLYEDFDVFTQDGTWTAPTGVLSITFALVGGGDGGKSGTEGTWEEDGKPGAGGIGGKVFVQTVAINAGQTFAVHIGAGGSPGQPGSPSTLGGSYSSAQGQVLDGYAILAVGGVYGRNGEDGNAIPGAENTGNGGGGGAAGLRGITGSDGYHSYIGRNPTSGGPGAAGGSGIVVIFYDKGDAS